MRLALLCLFCCVRLFQVEKTLFCQRQLERARMPKGAEGTKQFVVTVSEIDRAEILASARRAGVSPEEWLTAAARLPEQLISTTRDLASPSDSCASSCRTWTRRLNPPWRQIRPPGPGRPDGNVGGA
jgi:hypothetical protein